ncbi:hypothetical protein [Nostoc sp. FACHB-110]|uniref:hypothetical protein n=1 Tax=Nostoc sp. FACHB-110 TaxID=2692834 RepID=UPI00168A1C3D|nr:hypothetical protein [Nostoc sp. FACHB-110]MBD2438360.1 hypothetical protein [Nostoc sp. FACHB-110]
MKIGIEVLTNGIIDSFLGNDTIIGEGFGIFSEGIGISNSGSINSGLGNDTIKGTAFTSAFSRDYPPGVGIFNSTTGIIRAGAGDDSITGTGEGNRAIGISNQGNINGDSGNDEIAGVGTGLGAGGDAIGILNSGSISGGTGNDSVIGTGTGNLDIYGSGGDGIGISNAGMICGNAGKDNIIGTGTGGQGETYILPGSGGKGIGIVNTSSISSGIGDDLIIGVGKGGIGDGQGGDGIGISNNSYINAGSGSDLIRGIGLGGLGNSASDGRGVGISNTGRINASCGNDQIFGFGTTVGIEGNGVHLIGIEGGSGNDYFKARKINGLDASGNPIDSTNQDGAITNIFISGGNGKDTFDLGFGTAKLDGGRGDDILVLPVIGSGTYSIGLPDVNGWFQITNTLSTNVFTVSSIEHIVSGGVTLL